MISLRSQPPHTPTSSPHYISPDAPSNISAISLSAWYSSKISEFLRAAPQIPTNLYALVTSYLNIVNPYPTLPNELIHHIFTIAAQDDAETCRQLCLVSSWTRLMVLPFCMPIISVGRTYHWLLDTQSRTLPQKDWISPTLFTRALWVGQILRQDEELTLDTVDTDDYDIDFRGIFAFCPNVSALNATGECLLRMQRQGAFEVLRSTLRILSVPLGFSSCATDPKLRTLFADVEDLTFSVDDEIFDLTTFGRLSYLTVNAFSDDGDRLEEILSQLHDQAHLRTIAIGLSSITWQQHSHGAEKLSLDEIVNRFRCEDLRFAVPTPPRALGREHWRGRLHLSTCGQL